ncbi:MAG: response regulator [Bacteroidales bacterium]|nr:response regulator [Bacteroidales bacterium]
MKPIKILLVEDDEDDYIITSDIISEITRGQYQIDWINNFNEALPVICNQTHDLYLIDYNLGGYTGIDLIKKATESGCSKPMIMLTGVKNYETDLQAMQSGAVDYLVKGQINEDLLERSIRYAIGRKQIEQELKTSNATKDKLFSIIAHDLRGPIANFQSVIEIVTGDYDLPFDEKIELLKDLYNNVKLALELLENLLLWSRSHLDSLSFNKTEINICECLHSNITLLDTATTNKNIHIIHDCPHGLSVTADHNMLNTIFRNLLSNAVKFTPEGGKIMVTADKTNESVQINISDTGMGITSENLNKLFSPHEFHSTYGTNNEKGSGLGLKLCKEFAERHGGDIWFKSEVGKGSTFSFTIPLKYPSDHDLSH